MREDFLFSNESYILQVPLLSHLFHTEKSNQVVQGGLRMGEEGWGKNAVLSGALPHGPETGPVSAGSRAAHTTAAFRAANQLAFTGVCRTAAHSLFSPQDHRLTINKQLIYHLLCCIKQFTSIFKGFIRKNKLHPFMCRVWSVLRHIYPYNDDYSHEIEHFRHVRKFPCTPFAIGIFIQLVIWWLPKLDL